MGNDAGNGPAATSQVDFAILLWREDDTWQGSALPERVTRGLSAMLDVVRQQPSQAAVFVFVSVADDFFIAVRHSGDRDRFLLSDATAALEWPLARELLGAVGGSVPENDDAEPVPPAGDLSMFSDLGMEAMEVAALCEDLDLYPDEMLQSIADRIGAGAVFHKILDPSVV